MAAIFRLTPTTPGQARFDVTGVALPARDQGLEVSFESSDDTYIGADGSWQNTRYWHRLGRLPDPATTAFLAGPVIVDALSQVGSCRASARWKDGQAAGVLRIAGELIGSAGLKGTAALETATESAADQSGPPGLKPPPIPNVESIGKSSRLPLWQRTPLIMGIGGLLLVIAVAGTLWGLGIFKDAPEHKTATQGTTGVPNSPATDQPNAPQPSDPGSSRHAPGEAVQTQSGGKPGAKPGTGPTADRVEPAVTPRSPPNRQRDIALEPDDQPKRSTAAVPAPIPTPNTPAGAGSNIGAAAESPPAPTPYDAPQLRGRDYVAWLVDQRPDATTYRSQAQRRTEQGDCTAVILLYDRAAHASPEAAAQVARLYDPAGFQPSPCIKQPNANNAREYYELAGTGGIAEVQPRLDEMRGARTFENRNPARP